jgi:uncharacterized tellurite resistance protein B-like protein
MTDQDLVLLKSMIALAWADGDFSSGEVSWIEPVLEGMGATPGEKAQLLGQPAVLPSSAELREALPSSDDRETFLKVMLNLSLADGSTTPDEMHLLSQLSDVLGVSPTKLEDLRMHTLG